MSSSFKLNSDEPLWAVPSSVSKRLQSRQQDTEFNAFVFCGLYCLVATFFLLIFGAAALRRQELPYAYVIFGFALMTALCYFAIWLGKQYFLAKHLIAVLMGSLCLYLFFTGGTQGTGPVFYMVFPMVAVFLQGFYLGFVYIAVVSILTVLLYFSAPWGFDRGQYEMVLLTRIGTVYIITAALAILYSYFKHLSERDLLLIYDDLEQLTLADQRTGIANRRLMEKLLVTENKRFRRYGLKFSMMLVTIDAHNRVRSQYGQEGSDVIYRAAAEIFQKALREPDIPSLWSREEFLILLPHTGRESARIVAERLCKQITNQQFYIDGKAQMTTASIGLIEVAEENLEQSLKKLDMLLYKAIKLEGNQVVSE